MADWIPDIFTDELTGGNFDLNAPFAPTDIPTGDLGFYNNSAQALPSEIQWIDTMTGQPVTTSYLNQAAQAGDQAAKSSLDYWMKAGALGVAGLGAAVGAAGAAQTAFGGNRTSATQSTTREPMSPEQAALIQEATNILRNVGGYAFGPGGVGEQIKGQAPQAAQARQQAQSMLGQIGPGSMGLGNMLMTGGGGGQSPEWSQAMQAFRALRGR